VDDSAALGTSFATPLWAGFIALVNQNLAAQGGGYAGFINPTIYAIGKGSRYTSDFNDITTGNNIWSYSGSNFSAGSGYDLCTGLGTPIGQALINDFVPSVWSGSVTVNTSLTIPSGVTLSVQPGTNVKFAGGASLVVNGVLNAVGTSSQPITFTSTGSTSPGSWGSIQLNGSAASNSTISYANIQYGTEVDVTSGGNVRIIV